LPLLVLTEDALWPQIILTDEGKQLLMPAITRITGVWVADPFAQQMMLAAALLGAMGPLAC
jgi:hypothetical protein